MRSSRTCCSAYSMSGRETNQRRREVVFCEAIAAQVEKVEGGEVERSNVGTKQ